MSQKSGKYKSSPCLFRGNWCSIHSQVSSRLSYGRYPFAVIDIFIMVRLNDVKAANSALARKQPLVAVFVGGTAGIGEYTVRALTQHAANGPGLRLYLVGRKLSAAEALITECRAKFPAGEYHFVKAHDLALLKDVDRVSAEIVRLERERTDNPRIDVLVMSQGWLGFERHGE